MSDSLQNTETVIVALLIVALTLGFALRRLRLRRPDFNVGLPVAVAVGLRLAAIAGISSTGLGSTLRGGDETTFLQTAQHLAAQPFGHGFWPHGQYQLHTVVFALELKVGHFTLGAMRIVQVGFAVLGVVLIVAAVYDLASGRAAWISAWVLALEPTSVFFSSALHKEPLMMLATGLAVFGGTKIWRRLDMNGVALCAAGGLIAVETRSYAGWFLVSACVLLLLHAALRQLNRPLVAMPMIYLVTIGAFVATPVVLQASSKKNLQQLQISQNANTSPVSGRIGPNGNNLALERVNFSTRSAIISNLPKRIRDIVLKPYPWQLGDASQRFGAIGTVIAWAGLLLLLRYAWANRGRVFPRAGPLLYPLLFLLVAYSLSAGNAGTGFRYRTHLVVLGFAMLVVLRDYAVRSRAVDRAHGFGSAERERQLAGEFSPALH
jgi:hypothetical protein